MTTENELYTSFALPYSVTNEAHFSEIMSKIVLDLASSYTPSITRVVDIACGVGTACLYFSKQGYRVTGIDISYAMLALARKRAEELGYVIDFKQQNMKDLHINEKADLITCMYDSLNFMLTPENLTEVFKRVFNSLNPKGSFVFDIYTLLGLSECWGNKEEIHTNEPEHFIASKTTWDCQTHVATKTLYGFSQLEGIWKRWQEKHTMRTFSLEKITLYLTEAGFSTVSIYEIDDFKMREISASTKRALLIAHKQS